MLYSQIQADRLAAQKAGDSRLVRILKLILSELAYAQVDFKAAMPTGRQGELPDEEVIRVLMKEAKKRKDGIEIYDKAGSIERASEERYELKMIENYLPQMMSEEEVRVEVSKTAAETGLTGGRLMGAVMGRLKGKAEGSLVQRIVTENFP
jgi:hypothetical protein